MQNIRPSHSCGLNGLFRPQKECYLWIQHCKNGEISTNTYCFVDADMDTHTMVKIMKKKVIIFSAPSGAGKSTIVRHLLTKFNCLEFSVSATSRAPRGQEENGKDYWFFSTEEFESKITNGEFVEYEEVYKGSYYGTLVSEVERIWAKGNIIIFDIDVKGGVNLKKLYGENALAVFIQPPSVEELRNRLVGRGTDSPEAIERRVAKAEEELTYADKFDVVLVNDNLEEALAKAEKMVADFQAK